VPSESIKGVDHLATCYINVFSQAFLAGTPEDLPYLDRLATTGEFPIALPRIPPDPVPGRLEKGRGAQRRNDPDALWSLSGPS
jgi:hypothetical protein